MFPITHRSPPSRHSPRAIPALALALVLLAGLANEWTLPALLGRARESLQPRSLLAIRAIQCVALLGAVALATREWWSARLARVVHSRALGAALRLPDRRILAALLPLAVFDMALWGIACLRDEVRFDSMLAPLALAQKLVTDGLHVLVGVFAIVLVTRVPRAALLVTLIWSASIAAEALMFWFGGTRFEADYLQLATRASLSAYLTTGPVLFLVTALVAGAWSGWSIARHANHITPPALGRLLLLSLVVAAINLPQRYVDGTRIFRGPIECDEVETMLARLDYIQRDSLVHAIVEITRPASGARRIDTLEPYARVIERYSLGLNGPAPAPLPRTRVRRVVLIMGESLSRDFSGSHNPALPETLTPFLDSELAAAGSLIHHRANNQPTLPGVVATFLSHPNPRVAQQADRPPSLVNVLAEAGWRTIFLRSDSRVFGGSDLVLRDLGFEEQMGRDHFLADPRTAPYVSGWGACDRVVLEEAIDVLEEAGDQPVFLTVLSCDTHSPHGRRDYHGLEYPAEPAWIHEYEALAPLLRAVFRFDHDLRLFMTELAERGLYDEETLVVLTADHSCPITVDLLDLPGAHPTPFGHIALTLLSPGALPPFRCSRPTTQLDVAPTLLHLLGEPIPRGMWGRSLFDLDHPPPVFVGWFRGQLTVGLKEEQRIFRLDAAPTADHALLGELFQGWFAAR